MDIVNIIKKHFPIFIILILVISIVIIWSIGFVSPKEVTNESSQDYHLVDYHNKKYQYNTSIVSILLLGIDKDSSSFYQGQADAIELMVIDRSKKEISFIAISRETMTDIRVFDVEGNDLGWQKEHLNLAYGYASTKENGCLYTAQAVSSLLNDIPIVRYVSMDIKELKEIHDIVGELNVKVPNSSLQKVHKEWKKGQNIVLTKNNVESFLRSRDMNDTFSNTERMENHEVYIKAFYKKIKNMMNDSFDDVLDDLYKVSKNLTTNITYSDLKVFCKMILDYSFDYNNNYYVLQGKSKTGYYHDEFIVDQDQLDSLVIDMFYKEVSQ